MLTKIFLHSILNLEYSTEFLRMTFYGTTAQREMKSELMKKLKDAADKCKGLLKHFVSGVSMAEELIEERRREFKEDEQRR
jgi:hypothetical protein